MAPGRGAPCGGVDNVARAIHLFPNANELLRSLGQHATRRPSYQPPCVASPGALATAKQGDTDGSDHRGDADRETRVLLAALLKVRNKVNNKVRNVAL